jgi:transglutaminase-like putative cysteine protease
LRPEKLVPITKTFRTLAQKAVADKKDDLDRAKALYDHVIGRMRYDKSGTGWGRGDALYACDVRTGNCTDFHAYFIALARSIGIPARFAIGATIPADKTRAPSTAIIAGRNFWRMDTGFPWISAKRGKIPSLPIITSDIIRPIVSN